MSESKPTHPEVTSELSTENCEAFQSGCPFNHNDDNAKHPSILNEEAMKLLKEKCPAFKGACPFSAASDAHPTVSKLSDATKCPAFSNGCPLDPKSAGKSHPDVSKLWSSAPSDCKAMQSGFPFKKAKMAEKPAHPVVLDEPSTKKCPAFEAGCPFHDSEAHPSVLSRDAIAQLKEKCPAFKDACPFSGASDAHPTVTSLAEARKCPAFKDGCPLSSKSSSHPDIRSFWSSDISNCKAFNSGCPFKKSKMDTDSRGEEACPFLSGWHKSLHPCIYSLEHAKDCRAFQAENGCPFRAESKDKTHRLFGLDEESLKTISEKCPAWKNSKCPFGPESEVHPTISAASDIKKCPAFKDGGCVFNADSKAIAAHPNVSSYFKRPITDCSAFSRGCPFVTLGQEKPSESSGKRVKAQCPAFKEKCPFASVKTFAEFASRWGDVPSSHFDLIGSSNQTVSLLMRSVRRAAAPDDEKMDDGKPVAKDVGPGDKCPMGSSSSTTVAGSKKRKRQSMSAFEFAQVFAKMHPAHSKPGTFDSCPAFEDGCAFNQMSNGTVAEKKLGEKPLSELVSKCPAFTDGQCPFSG